MNQKSRASADVSNSGWDPTTDYYRRISEAEPNDSTVISSIGEPASQSFIVRLAQLAWPRAGSQIVKVRFKRTGSEDVPMIINLLQGNTVIASHAEQATGFFDTYSFELSESQIQQITDYTNLRLRVQMGTAFCADGEPLTLGMPVTRDLPQFAMQLFKINVFADLEYYVKLTVNVGGFLTAIVTSGPPGTYEYTLSESTPCRTLIKPNNYTICVQVGPDTLEDSNYTIEVGEGPCP